MVKTHDTKYFTQNLDFSCNDNGIHSVILWLKAVVALLLIEGLHCGRVLYQGNYNVAVICSWLLLYQNLITIEDSCIDHAVAFYLQHEALFIGHKFCRDGEVAIYILYSQNRLSGGYGTYKRNIDHFTADKIEIVINDLYGSWLRGIAADVSVLLKSFQMGMNR